MKNNSWEDKLKHRFDDFESTLREEQWDRLESALVQPKVNRFKRWMWFMLAAGLVGTGFTLGYWVAQANQNNRTRTANYATLSTNQVEDSFKKEAKEKPVVNEIFSSSENDLSVDQIRNTERNIRKNYSNHEELEEGSAIKIKKSENQGGVLSIEDTNSVTKGNDYLTQNKDGFLSLSRKPDTSLKELLRFSKSSFPILFVNDDTQSRKMKNEHDRKSKLTLSPLFGYYISRTNAAEQEGLIVGDLVMEIANSIENQSFRGSGMRVGFEAKTPIFKGLNLSAGLLYNHQRIQNNFTQIHRIVPVFHDSISNVIVGLEKLSDDAAPRSEVDIDNQISMLQLPFKLHYELPLGSKFRLGLSAGYQFNIPLQMNLNYFDILNFEYINMDKELYRLGSQQMAGVHLYYELSTNLDLGLNYSFASSTNSVNFLGYQVKLENRNHMFDIGLSVHL